MMRWQAPARLAPGTIVDEHLVRTTDPRAGLPSVEPRPVLDAEMALWSKPNASVCFPVHPSGALVLIDRAIELAQDCLPTDEARREQLLVEIARLARLLYVPGASVRSAMDRFIEQKAYLPPREPGVRPVLGQKQLSLLASHHLLLAAGALAGEAL